MGRSMRVTAPGNDWRGCWLPGMVTRDQRELPHVRRVTTGIEVDTSDVSEVTDAGWPKPSDDRAAIARGSDRRDEFHGTRRRRERRRQGARGARDPFQERA